MTGMHRGVSAGIAFLALAGCAGGETVRRPARELGERLFSSPSLSDSSFNDFACADCHAVRAADDADRRYAGFPMEGVTARPSWWNGQSTQLLDAVNFCLVYFMRGSAIVPGEIEGDALYEFLASISTGEPEPGIPFTLVTTVQALPAGDADSGREVYDLACRACHGARGSGKGRLSSAVTVLGEDLSAEYDELFPGVDHDLLVIEKVRHGQFFGVGGNMPPFARERLSDEDLSDLVAYLDL